MIPGHTFKPFPSTAFTTVETLSTGSAHYTATWTIPSYLPYFEGHFPGKPVLPAIAILDFSIQAVEKVSQKKESELRSIFSAKFMEVIGPAMNVQIQVSSDSNRWKVRWLSEEKILADIVLEY